MINAHLVPGQSLHLCSIDRTKRSRPAAPPSNCEPQSASAAAHLAAALQIQGDLGRGDRRLSPHRRVGPRRRHRAQQPDLRAECRSVAVDRRRNLRRTSRLGRRHAEPLTARGRRRTPTIARARPAAADRLRLGPFSRACGELLQPAPAGSPRSRCQFEIFCYADSAVDRRRSRRDSSRPPTIGGPIAGLSDEARRRAGAAGPDRHSRRPGRPHRRQSTAGLSPANRPRSRSRTWAIRTRPACRPWTTG